METPIRLISYEKDPSTSSRMSLTRKRCSEVYKAASFFRSSSSASFVPLSEASPSSVSDVVEDSSSFCSCVFESPSFDSAISMFNMSGML